MSLGRNEFFRPSAQFRAKPFWAWNAKLEEKEMRRQIRVLSEMGFGGFFMHSRVGLDTAYLSPEWFQLVKVCIDEAQKNNAEAWLYDEDRWPSGAAGGLVTKDTRYRLRFMTADRKPVADYQWPTDGEAVYVFAATFDGDNISQYRQIAGPEEIASLNQSEEIIECVLRIAPCVSWFNDCTYLDTMNPQAVQAFIDTTHEAYRREVGEHFGKTIPGMFTDEPNHGLLFRNFWSISGSLPWTNSLPETFQKLFGYDIIPYLPELAYDLADGSFSQHRYFYHRCKSRMFSEAFSKLLSQWCGQNNLLHTGHVLEEHPISANVTAVGSAMQFYAYMQAPGVDMLTQYRMEYIAVKACSSVARQAGRTWVLSELYGCTGWETTFETYKHSGDWQAALGINLRCPHLSWYSMAGTAKRDYPASIHFQSPWWRQYRHVEDYFGRVNVALTAGQPICDLAVIHPVETLYLLCNRSRLSNPQEYHGITNETLGKYDQQYDDLAEWLLGNHLDFDFADEELLIDFDCSVGSDDLGPFFTIGAMNYRAVLVPPLLTLRQSTLDKLREFAQAGGKVVFAGTPAPLIDAKPSDAVARFAADKTVNFDPDSVVKALSDNARCVNIITENNQEATDIFYQLRLDGDNWILFMNNNNRETSRNGLRVRLGVALNPDAQIQRWDPVTGQAYNYPGAVSADAAQFQCDIPASGSALFVIDAQPAELPAWPNLQPTGQKLQLDPAKWDYALDDRNALVLDRADCTAISADKKNFRCSNQEILRIDDDLRDHLGIRRRGGFMVQPWAAKDTPLGPTAQTTLTYSFNIRSMTTTPVWLALEQPQRWNITINGRGVSHSLIDGWWVDPAIETVPLDLSLLKKGKNIIALQGRFDRHTNLEIMYLLGSFGVRNDGAKGSIGKLPAKLTLGDWTSQGLPFYSGNVTYSTAFNFDPQQQHRYLLRLPECQATVVEVALNNAEPLVSAWPDYQLDITDQLKPGKNTIAVKLLSSRRNAFGPLHNPEDNPYAVGPHSYEYNPKIWQENFKIIPYGIFQPPTIVENNDISS